MELVKMRSYWMEVDPKSNATGVLIRGEETQPWGQEEDHVAMKTEIAAIYMCVKEHRGLSANTRKLGGGPGADSRSGSRKEPTLPTP